MRSSIIKTIINFKNNNKSECQLCKISDNNKIYHVDHIIPFTNLKNDFLKITKFTLPISFSTCSNTG